MIPGQTFIKDGEIELNAGRKTVTLTVANTGDRPIQVGSHYHFFETNEALAFDRAKARGFRLDIASGTAVRFEPGQQRTVELVDYVRDMAFTRRGAWRSPGAAGPRRRRGRWRGRLTEGDGPVGGETRRPRHLRVPERRRCPTRGRPRGAKPASQSSLRLPERSLSGVSGT